MSAQLRALTVHKLDINYVKDPLPSFTATPEHNNVVFVNLSVADIGTGESIVSAEIRVMIETTDPQPPLPWYGRLFLYDKFSHSLIHSQVFQGGAARRFVFPVRALVKRWLFSPSWNHGIYFRLKSHSPDANFVSLTVMAGLKAPRNHRPLLVVQTYSKKAQGIEDIPFLMREQILSASFWKIL